MLFGTPVDRFLMDLQNPPEEMEMIVTEELYQVAVKSRMLVDDDHETYDYQPPQDAMSKPRPPAMIKTMGYDDGWNRRWPREPKNERYMLEYTMGAEQERSEHRDTTTVLVFESSGMSNYARRGRAGA